MPLRARPTHRRAALALLASAGIAAACREPAAAGDPRACQQTAEFGNTGCFEVAGQVVGTAGLALAGVVVGPRYLPGRDGFNTAYVTTDTAGHFRLRLIRVGGRPVGLAGPDTLSVFVEAADPRSADVGIPARVRDSILAVVTVAPVGAVPVPAVVRITLPVP
jgi:hypothetical protein